MSSNLKVKLLMVGDSGVGKSCLVTRFVKENFSDNFTTTIGVDFLLKEIEIENQPIALQVWDTAGQERFRTITVNYYHGAHGIALVYDITNETTFHNLQSWIDDVDKYAPPSTPKLIFANKSDLFDSRVIDYNQAFEFSQKNSIEFIEVSAKTSNGVNDAFLKLATLAYSNIQKIKQKKETLIDSSSQISEIIEITQLPSNELKRTTPKPNQSSKCCA
eukprot:TRINITY_DN1224_c5_g1_i1.p1 TRINITY_DN1224_c5_g1~~TRINITY_DN1224_c5_g1_i1.p1  ORF type:complete len:218 (+),score=98.99 TRINITY_DN1224_c5_g1_i1:68-721(+)